MNASKPAIPALLCALLLSLTSLYGVQEVDRRGGLVGLNEEFQGMVRKASPSIVQIFVTGYAPVEDGAFVGSGLPRVRSGGSGVIVDPMGYIVTNYHVVENAVKIQVRTSTPARPQEEGDQSILRPLSAAQGAQLVGFDRETDLAVLKIEGQDLPYLALGDSDQLRQGQLVMAFGSPLGLEGTVTLGVVSAVARQLEPEDPMVYVQTDAPINPGSSGGPLLNIDGQVVGINTFILSQSGGNEGIGFAAPSNIVGNVYRQIKQFGRVRRGIIGVHAQTITPLLAEGLGLDRDWGVILGDVLPSSPASVAGLQIGDIVLSLNGKRMENGRQFDVNLYRYSVGDSVTLEVLRDGQKLSRTVQVLERPEDTDRFSQLVDPERHLVPALGVLAVDITPEVAQLLPSPRKLGGILVAARALDAPPYNGGLLPGDILYGLNQTDITSLRQLRQALDQVKTGQPLVLQVLRQGRFRYLALVKED
ncbi:MAG TPA: trypsin-like peptidase domain-containing protein [Acidobacteriota bacterium]|nr:trypsin-like peptidase domain-containing protein [Acidobacteriota bacterium]